MSFQSTVTSQVSGYHSNYFSEKHTFLLLWAEDFLDLKDCVTFLLLPILIITFSAHWIEENNKNIVVSKKIQ